MDIKKLVVNSFERLSILAMIILSIGIVVVSTSNNGIVGLFVGAALAILISVLLFGFLFLIMEMNQNLRGILKILTEEKGKESR